MKPKIKAFILALVIFLGGVTGGVFLDRLYFDTAKKAQIKHFKKFMGPKRFDVIQDRLQTKFTRKLNLTLTQQDQLRKIFKRRMGLIKARAIEHDTEIESMKEVTRKEIFTILTPAQKDRFAEMIKAYKARRRQSQ